MSIAAALVCWDPGADLDLKAILQVQTHCRFLWASLLSFRFQL